MLMYWLHVCDDSVSTTANPYRVLVHIVFSLGHGPLPAAPAVVGAPLGAIPAYS